MKAFVFSAHCRGKGIDVDLVRDCVHTGRKAFGEGKAESRKRHRRGELVVVYRDLGDYVFVITAFWNTRGGSEQR